MRKLTAIVIAVLFASPAVAQSSPATVTPAIDTTRPAADAPTANSASGPGLATPGKSDQSISKGADSDVKVKPSGEVVTPKL